MQKLLVAVDGSANSERAVVYAGRLAENNLAVEIHLLNVQPAILAGKVKAYLTQNMIEDWHREEGEKALESAKSFLDRGNTPYKAHLAAGDPSELIAQYAKELSCDAIVMGARGLGSIASLVLGSVATKVLHLVDVPVTLVK